MIHCSVTRDGEELPMETLRQWHLERGFTDIGYHLVIQPNGQVDRGRGLNEPGAHVEGANSDSIGICLVGTDKFTKEQFVALRYKLDSIFLSYTIPKWAIYCHYQFASAIKQKKTCPNIEVNRLLYWYTSGDEKAISQYIFRPEGV